MTYTVHVLEFRFRPNDTELVKDILDSIFFISKIEKILIVKSRWYKNAYLEIIFFVNGKSGTENISHDHHVGFCIINS